MVVNIIKWRPWIQSKKFEVKIVVHCIKGLNNYDDDGEKGKMRVVINWDGKKMKSLKKRNSTNAKELGKNGVVEWEEEFKNICGFCGNKDVVDHHVFLPLEIAFLVFNGSQMDAKKKGPLAIPAVVNLAEFASSGDASELDMNIPLSMHGCGFNCCPSLCISLRLTELKTTHEFSDEVVRPMFAPLSPCFGGASVSMKKEEEEEEGSTFKARMKKVKSLKDFVSSRKSKKACHEEDSSHSKLSTGSDSDYNYPFDTDSSDDTEKGESEESTEGVSAPKSCGYESLVQANLVRGGVDLKVNCQDEELIYYSNKRLKLDISPDQELDPSISEQLMRQNSKFGILAWRKKKLSLRSPRVKGEPLLKKDYREDGGDDIDFDRRQLSSDESMFEDSVKSGTFSSEFGDDNFAIGSWEIKELTSRDGSLKLRTKVFFASIDQRSERAAGESACTALVAVIADWIHANHGEMPIKSDFDSLIREGSLQWRTLCENEDYRQRFPDKHFDLETVIQAKIRPLTVVPEKSFIGFFHPEGLEEECFHFLKDSMSFDDIWGEISQAASELTHNSEPLVYVVSWNDHFFLLRVDRDAFYIIDTLGERLFEGCDQAFVLKFDGDTMIENIPVQNPLEDGKDPSKKSPIVDENSGSSSPEHEIEVIRGVECCKEYIKSFLAAIPIRELQGDMMKGLISSTPLHHRLQIEFNYTAQILVASDENTANVQASIEAHTPVSTKEVTDVQDSVTGDTAASMMVVVAA